LIDLIILIGENISFLAKEMINKIINVGDSGIMRKKAPN